MICLTIDLSYCEQHSNKQLGVANFRHTNYCSRLLKIVMQIYFDTLLTLVIVCVLFAIFVIKIYSSVNWGEG